MTTPMMPGDPVPDDAPAASGRPKPAVVGAIGVVLTAVVVSFVQARKHDAQLADFGAYYRAGRAVAAGRSPYTLDAKFGALGAYMYCPAFAFVVCRPLAALPYPWAVRAFLAVNWGVTIAAVGLSVRLAGARFWAGVIGCAAAGMYLWSDLHNGQVGTVLLLACLGWLALTLAGRPVVGGISLSLAIGLKLYPALLVPYLLLRRRWWPGLIGVAIGLTAQFAAPALFVGGRGLLPLHREWLAFCLHTQVPMQTYRAGNESLLGALARTPPVSDGVHLFSPERLATLQRVYPAVVLGITAATYGWLLVRRTRDPVADVAVLLVWMTLAGPRAWTFNLAAELPGAVLLATAAVGRRRRWPLAVVALVGLVYAVACPTNPPLLPLPTRWTFGTQFLYDKHFLAAALLAVAVAVTPPGAPVPPRRT